MQKFFSLLLPAAIALAALTACGGGTKNTSTTTQNQAASSPAAGAMSGAAMGGAPASLHCGATAPVWANSKSHVYHTSSDPLYGKTKHGRYMCAQTAIAQGYHAANSKAGTSAAMRSGKRHHKGGSMMAQPQPSPT
ncbi:MAG: hypothetical protein ABR508_12130 [Candidatus Baltobacteraceae bacterium]